MCDSLWICQIEIGDIIKCQFWKQKKNIENHLPGEDPEPEVPTSKTDVAPFDSKFTVDGRTGSANDISSI